VSLKPIHDHGLPDPNHPKKPDTTVQQVGHGPKFSPELKEFDPTSLNLKIITKNPKLNQTRPDPHV
jgi:hypothetical protein